MTVFEAEGSRDPTPVRHARPAAPVILVVEDHEDLGLEACDLLGEAGFEALEAQDARAALVVMQDRPDIRVLFTDVEMPGDIDGIDLAREVHDRWPLVYLLVTSGQVEVREDDLPDDGRFVPKPYRASTLIAQGRHLIAHGHSS